MYAFFRKWFDRTLDIAEDFNYKDFFWFEMLVLSIGVLFGISTSKILKYISPLIFLFAAFSAFEVLYPRKEKIHDMVTGDYEDRFVEFEDSDEFPDFV